MAPDKQIIQDVGIIDIVGSIINRGYHTQLLFPEPLPFQNEKSAPQRMLFGYSSRKTLTSNHAQRQQSGSIHSGIDGVGKDTLTFAKRQKTSKAAKTPKAVTSESAASTNALEDLYQYLTENMPTGSFCFLEKPPHWEKGDQIKIIQESQKSPLTIEVRRHGVLSPFTLSPKKLTDDIKRYDKTCALEGANLNDLKTLFRSHPKINGPVRNSRKIVSQPNEGDDLLEYSLLLDGGPV